MGLWCNKKKLCRLHFIRFAGRQTSQIKKDSWKCQSSYGNHEWPRQDPVEVDQSDPEVRTTVLTNLFTTETDNIGKECVQLVKIYKSFCVDSTIKTKHDAASTGKT